MNEDDIEEEDDDSEEFRSDSESSKKTTTSKRKNSSKSKGIVATLILMIVIVGAGIGVFRVISSNSASSSNCGKPEQPCSADEIAKHNKQTDCWVIYDGSYYNVTAWVSQHPGTPDAFNANTCGKDITLYLKGQKDNDGLQHIHMQKAYDTLKTFRVGPVQG